MNLRPCECGSTVYNPEKDLCTVCDRKRNWVHKPWRTKRHHDDCSYDSRPAGMNSLIEPVEDE